MNTAHTHPIASTQEMELFQLLLQRLEQEHPGGLTMEQIQAVADQVANLSYERFQRQHHRPASSR